MRIGLLPKTVAILAVVGLVPVSLLGALLWDASTQAVQKSENLLQTAVVSEVAKTTSDVVHAAQRDAEAIAFALAELSKRDQGGDDPFASVRLILATRTAIDGARFEVPSAKVSTVIRQKDETDASFPSSTDALRADADQRGVGFVLLDAQKGAITVPIPRADPQKGAKGYVTVRVHTGEIEPRLLQLADTQFSGGQVRILVVDGAQRAVATVGTGIRPGADTKPLPIWARLPDGVPWMQRTAVVTDHLEGDERMVGVIESIPELKWGVALWRPRRVAYAQLEEMRKKGLVAGGLALGLAALVGLVAARRISKPVVALAAQAKLIGQRRWREVRVEGDASDEIGDLGQGLATMAKDLEASEDKIAEEARLRGDLSRFLNRDLVTKIVAGEHPLTLGGRRLPVTVLFADVVAFTPLAESRPPEEVVALLNELFSLLTEVVFRHGGTVDKFVGDSIMAVWGAPFPSDDHADKALMAAEDMLRFVETANEGWRATYGVEIKLGIGVNTGEAIAGNIGSDKRMEYTVIGDTVNIAARLEGLAAPNQVLVSDATAAAAKDDPPLEKLGPRKLSGRATEIDVYRLDVG